MGAPSLSFIKWVKRLKFQYPSQAVAKFRESLTRAFKARGTSTLKMDELYGAYLDYKRNIEAKWGVASFSPSFQNDADDETLLSETVEQTVRDHLKGGAAIVSVNSHRGYDFDGDEIISVEIVISAPLSNFAPRSLSSLVRILKGALSEIGVSAFPMVAYMTEAERKIRKR